MPTTDLDEFLKEALGEDGPQWDADLDLTDDRKTALTDGADDDAVPGHDTEDPDAVISPDDEGADQ